MDSKILIGIIAVTIFGTLGIQGTMVQAGVFPIETIKVVGDGIDGGGTSVMTCPASHPFIISGTYSFGLSTINPPIYDIEEIIDPATNSYTVTLTIVNGFSTFQIIPEALCANFNFPMQMGMVGGQLLDINTLPLLVGAIGVNPIITGLVGITIAGVVAQTVWFIHRRRKSE